MARAGITAKLLFGSVHKGFKDIELPDERDTTEVRSRGWDFVRELIGQRKFSVESSAEIDSEGAIAVMAAYHSKATTTCVFYDACLSSAGYGAGTQRVSCPMKVTKCAKSYPISGEAVVSFTLAIDAETTTEESISFDDYDDSGSSSSSSGGGGSNSGTGGTTG